MVNIAKALESAKQQYRIAFMLMARGGKWCIYLGQINVVLAEIRGTEPRMVLVNDVHAMSEDKMMHCLEHALKRLDPDLRESCYE